MAQFTKISTGEYDFRASNGAIYTAVKNEAGFAHRNWDVRNIAGSIVADQLGSRNECVEAIEQQISDSVKMAEFSNSESAAAIAANRAEALELVEGTPVHFDAAGTMQDGPAPVAEVINGKATGRFKVGGRYVAGPAKPKGTTKVTLTVTIEVDRDAYEAEYGSSATVEELRLAFKTGAVAAVESDLRDGIAKLVKWA